MVNVDGNVLFVKTIAEGTEPFMIVCRLYYGPCLYPRSWWVVYVM